LTVNSSTVAIRLPSSKGPVKRHKNAQEVMGGSTRAVLFDADKLGQVPDRYRKPMPAVRLSERIGLAQIEAAASVETGLRDLLLLLGFRLARQ
jgi:hypothetical protein